MLKMIKGCRVPFADRLEEAYEVGEKRIFANVDADKIEEVVRHFITMHEEPQFFILELPASIDEETVASPGVMEKFHKTYIILTAAARRKRWLSCVRGRAFDSRRPMLFWLWMSQIPR